MNLLQILHLLEHHHRLLILGVYSDTIRPMQNSQFKEQKKIGAMMLAFMWIGIFTLLALFFSSVISHQNNPNPAPQTKYLTGYIKELVLQRNRFGHYVANGQINNVDVVFMLDTGATDVSIPVAIANKLNLTPGPSQIYSTANGPVKVNLTRLDQISLGDITLNNIRGTINPGFQGNEILLGMSFLKHLEFSQRGDQLTLKQYPQGL